MNIFYLDTDPIKAAQYQCDKHVVKMTLESTQLLATAFHCMNMGTLPKSDGTSYKPTHINHPCAKWVRENQYNLAWLVMHAQALAIEYTSRYQKIHASTNAINHAYYVYTVYYGSPESQWKYHVIPPQCMPQQYRQRDAVEAYREYYRREKYFAKWNKLHNKPYWY